MSRTHLHTRTLVCSEHLKGNLLRACRDSIKLDLDLGLGEVVDTAYRRYIECITQIDRCREDAVIDFCSTTSFSNQAIRPMNHMDRAAGVGFVLPINVKVGTRRRMSMEHNETHPLVSCIRLE